MERFRSTLKLQGHVAQWIEHQVPVLRVGGSNPSMLVRKLYKLKVVQFESRTAGKLLGRKSYADWRNGMSATLVKGVTS